MVLNKLDKDICFIYSGPHPVHEAFAKTVCNKFYPSFTYKKYRLPFLKNIDAILRGFLLPYADIYLCESGTDLLVAIPRKILNPKIKIIALVASSYGIMGRTNILSKSLMKIILNKCDGIIAVSAYIKNKLRSEGIKINIKVVNPFLDVDRFSKIKARLDNKRFLYIGRNHPERNIKFLIRVFKNLPYKLTIVGNGFEKREFSNNIHFEAATRNIEKYLIKNTFYIDLSMFAPYPVAVLEAIAAGEIPILSKDCGNSEILKKVGESELVINNYDSKLVAEKIEKIVKKPIKWRKKIVFKLKRRVLRLNKNRQCKLFKKTFNEMIKAI
ncbi:MAG: glycosyltransferase family 4 protein [Candidatus Micrarchaeia archaeon]